MTGAARLIRRIPLLATAILFAMTVTYAYAQENEQSIAADGGSQTLLQSIHVPLIPNAPFSLTLSTEWTRPMANGGTFTVVNTRAIKRDRQGRLYEERWLLAPKGSNGSSRMNYIQIADPTARTLYNCSVFRHVCELLTLSSSEARLIPPSLFKSGPLPGGKGSILHEDLGVQTFAGLPVHGYRDTTTFDPGALGNDLPMAIIREFRYSSELGINLSSMLDNPQSGHQVFTVTAISTTDPDPALFQIPIGYKVVDRRNATSP